MGGYYRDRSPGRGYDRGYERRYDTGYDRGYGGYGGRGAERDIVREPPSRCSLLVRGLSRDTRGEDLRAHAEKYGKVRDVYMPVDYYTREPRGIGFVEFYSSEDAEEAKYAMDRLVILGREISVVFAKQGRKRPDDYRRRGAPPRRGPSRYSPGRYSPRYRDRDSPPRRRRSPSPDRERSPRRSRTRSVTRSRSRSPSYRRSKSYTPKSRSRSREPTRSRSPANSPRDNDREPSRSPPRESPPYASRSPSPAPPKGEDWE